MKPFSFNGRATGLIVCLRGPAGNMGLRPLVWKPATLSVLDGMLFAIEDLKGEDWATIDWPLMGLA